MKGGHSRAALLVRTVFRAGHVGGGLCSALAAQGFGSDPVRSTTAGIFMISARQARDRAGSVQIFQSANLFLGQVNVQCIDCVGNVVRFGCADDRRSDAGAASGPCKRDLRHRYAAFAGNLSHDINDFLILGQIKALGKGVLPAAQAVINRRFGQSAARQRAPRNNGNALILAQRNDLAFFFEMATDEISGAGCSRRFLATNPLIATKF